MIGRKLSSGIIKPPLQDLNNALDNIFNHPNVGPFVGKQLIQHLVKSNPGPAYVSRVAAAFNNNGQGVRGDMPATISAVLLDPEARANDNGGNDQISDGHLQKPALFIAAMVRAFGGQMTDQNYFPWDLVNLGQDLFDASRHDSSDKIFLGQRIPAGGEDEGIAAIDILAKSPATARHIAFELAQYFVADNPPPALIDRLAQRFLDSDGDIKAVMKTLLTSAEFRDSVGQKYKTPYQYVVSAVRAVGVGIKSPSPFLGAMAELGMPLYLCPTPDGYKNTEDAWLSPASTTARTNFAVSVGSGALLAYVPPSEELAPRLVADKDALALDA